MPAAPALFASIPGWRRRFPCAPGQLSLIVSEAVTVDAPGSSLTLGPEVGGLGLDAASARRRAAGLLRSHYWHMTGWRSAKSAGRVPAGQLRRISLSWMSIMGDGRPEVRTAGFWSERRPRGSDLDDVPMFLAGAVSAEPIFRGPETLPRCYVRRDSAQSRATSAKLGQALSMLANFDQRCLTKAYRCWSRFRTNVATSGQHGSMSFNLWPIWADMHDRCWSTLAQIRPTLANTDQRLT